MIAFSRRVIAVAAAVMAFGTGSAVAVTTAASAAPGKPAAPAAAPRCFGSDLAVWVNADARGVIGDSVRYHLTFTNLGKQACTLSGFPKIVATTAGGKQLGAPAAHEGGVPATTVVTLQHGQSAHTIFGYKPGQVIPSCKPGFATQLKVFAPGVALGKHAFFPVPACTTGRLYMYTWRVQPGF